MIMFLWDKFCKWILGEEEDLPSKAYIENTIVNKPKNYSLENVGKSVINFVENFDWKYFREVDGKVAVLYSPRYGGGWYSWNCHKEGVGQECIFCPEIVEIVEHEDYPNTELVLEVGNLAEKLFGEGFYYGGTEDLQVKWLPEGTAFRIDEYDGYESVEILGDVDWILA